jgi:regulator of PEP synthase PpsR (kinase-PPPase family)
MLRREIGRVLAEGNCYYLELFDAFLPGLREEIGMRPSGIAGLSHGISDNEHYDDRMSIINFAMANDDGMRLDRFGDADVILIGVSRSGKTPTCLYLAMHFGIRAANYPLTEEDFEHGNIPDALLPFREKLIGLYIDPQRLNRIREERRSGSRYASLANCHKEVREANRIFSKLKVNVMDTTTQSIEEISSRIIKKL